MFTIDYWLEKKARKMRISVKIKAVKISPDHLNRNCDAIMTNENETGTPT